MQTNEIEARANKIEKTILLLYFIVHTPLLKTAYHCYFWLEHLLIFH